MHTPLPVLSHSGSACKRVLLSPPTSTPPILTCAHELARNMTGNAPLTAAKSAAELTALPNNKTGGFHGQ